MAKLNCPICEIKIDIADDKNEKGRITCPNCFAQLAVYKHKGRMIFGCAYCKESVFDPARCDECERRHEKKRLLEEGRL